ncbi:MAG: hypothetical protein D6806_10720 [Deltaproteobacteria bacterium]|nr:MAG: hypothetical protein D6806_10720 [Deltaproteobacteria bacterium]
MMTNRNIENREPVIGVQWHEGVPEPVTIRFEGCKRRVLGIADRWHDERAKYFMARAEDGCRYLLRFDLETLEWSVLKRELLDA